MKVTLVCDDFHEYSWFYILRQMGLISNELSYEQIHVNEDEWEELLPEYTDMFKESAYIELEYSNFIKNF